MLTPEEHQRISEREQQLQEAKAEKIRKQHERQIRSIRQSLDKLADALAQIDSSPVRDLYTIYTASDAAMEITTEARYLYDELHELAYQLCESYGYDTQEEA